MTTDLRDIKFPFLPEWVRPFITGPWAIRLGTIESNGVRIPVIGPRFIADAKEQES